MQEGPALPSMVIIPTTILKIIVDILLYHPGTSSGTKDLLPQPLGVLLTDSLRLSDLFGIALAEEIRDVMMMMMVTPITTMMMTTRQQR